MLTTLVLAQAVAYYTLSADLGDVDAQLDLAFCLAHGKGCKKNTKLAAKVRLNVLGAQRSPSLPC